MGRHFTLPTSDVAQPEVATVLRAAGAVVDVVEAYRTVASETLPPPVAEALRQGRVHAVVCMSPSAVETLVALSGAEPLRPLVRAAPGETTARAWLAHGLPSEAVAARPQPQALVEALAACMTGRPRV